MIILPDTHKKSHLLGWKRWELGDVNLKTTRKMVDYIVSKMGDSLIESP